MSDGLYRIFNIESKGKLTTIAGGIGAAACLSGLDDKLHAQRITRMTIAKGDKLPDVGLVKATSGGPEKVASGDFFAGRKVALFAVPGAFTPTCSAKHLPGFVEKAGELKAKGVDEIACVSVNDAFVMGAWNKASGSDDITMLADGSGTFARALGLDADFSAYGMGTRSNRYSMIVDDGVVTEMNVEGPGEFGVSSAEHLLGQL